MTRGGRLLALKEMGFRVRVFLCFFSQMYKIAPLFCVGCEHVFIGKMFFGPQN